MQRPGLAMRRPPLLRRGVMALALALAACTTTPPGPLPDRPISPTPVRPVPQETAASAETRQRYAQVQQALLSQGLLRTDSNAEDAPFTDRMLAENFLRIAFYDEFDRALGGTTRSEAPSPMQRWAAPVRVSLRFGASVPAESRATDTARVASYLALLQRVSGHPISLDDNAPNFVIRIASVDERAAMGPELTSVLSELTPTQIAAVTRMEASTYCLVYAQSDGASHVIQRAFAVIPSEHPDLLRLSCLHEEIAQGLGLTNDSRRARPSIFNDDEEFALLTRQDELMLAILYHPALRPGMTEAEARPLVFDLASRLLGGDS
jgi:hypothetical protein